MTKLTRKNAPFKWDEKCQNALKLAKIHLQQAPVMVYPDKSKVFHLFMDVSQHTWSSALMQTLEDSIVTPPHAVSLKEGKGSEHTPGKQKKHEKQPPYIFFNGKLLQAIVFHSGSFSGSQIN